MSATTSDAKSTLFARSTIIALALISIVSFVAYVVLSAYADELDPGQDGHEHALSRSAVGYAGIVRLMNDTSPGSAILSRSEDEQYNRGLNIVTLERWQDYSEEDYYTFYDPTLIILPKWNTFRIPHRRGWVELPPKGLRQQDEGASIEILHRNDRTIHVEGFEHVLDVAVEDAELTPTLTFVDGASRNISYGDDADYQALDIQPAELAKPVKHLQTISSEHLLPVIVDSNARIVVGQIEDSLIFVLAEADLINNAGIADITRARFSIELINALKQNANPTYFDLTKHGFERSRNMMKLAFEPPFGAATLTTFLAALILAWRSGVRFGPTHRGKRAYALGKRALADNSASLIRMAGREHRYAAGYADLISRLAGRAAGAPRELHGEALDRFLDRYGGRDDEAPTIHQLREDAQSADNRASLTNVARRLYLWKQEFDRERR